MRSLLTLIAVAAAVGGIASCGNDAPPESAAIQHRERMPIMVSHGVSKIISDSGVNRYKMIT